jgi:hypothetical protein
MLRSVYCWVVLSCLLTGAVQEARGQPLSQDDIARFIAGKMSRDRILAISHSRCLSFVADAQGTQPLLAQSGDSALITGLRDACYLGSALVVVVDRTGVRVAVDDQPVGEAPWKAPRPPGHVLVAVEQGSWSQHETVDLLRGQSVTVTFHVPADTQPNPGPPSQAELVALAQDTLAYTPKVSKPIPPVPPGSRGTLGSTIIGALVGGAAGAGIGLAACNTKSPVYTNTSGGYGVQTGTKSSIDGGCTAAAAGGGVAIGGLVGNLIARAGHGAKVRQYQRDSSAYVIKWRYWQQQNATDSATAVSAKRRHYQEVKAAAARAQQIAELNAQTREHNARLVTEINVGSPLRFDHPSTLK